MTTRLQEILKEVKMGVVTLENLKHLCTDLDDEDIIEVILAAVKERASSKDVRKRRIGKYPAASVLIVAIVQQKLTTDYNKARHLALTILNTLMDNNLDFLPNLFNNLIAMSSDPSWPAAAFVFRLAYRLLSPLITNHNKEPDLNVKKIVFTVKVVCKYALSLKKRETDLKDVTEEVRRTCERDLVKLSQLVFGYVQEETDFLNKNALSAYKTLWKDRIGESNEGDDYSLRTKNEALAALHMISSILYEEDFMKYSKLILLAASSQKIAVKNEASKSFGKLLYVCPAILEVSGAATALKECLLTADGKALPNLISNMCAYLAKHPGNQNIDQYNQHLLRLLNHHSMMVRRAAIDGIGYLLSKFREYPCRERLALGALVKIEDEEQVIQQAVCRFFSTVYCETNNSNGLIDVVSSSTVVFDAIEKILNQTSATKKVQCESQLPLSIRQSVVSENDNLEILCAALAMQLKDSRKQIYVSCILHIFAKVHPVIVSKQSDTILEAFKHCNWVNERLLEQLCKILVCIKGYTSLEEFTPVIDHVKKLIEEFPLRSVSSVPLFTHLLQVLLSYLTSSDNYIKERIEYGLKVLRENKPNEDMLESDIKKALCYVVYWNKNYDDEKATRLLIRSYLASTKYDLTVLHALSQSRLHYVPTRYDPYIKQVILHNLKVESVPVDLVETSLWFICNSLIGYNSEKLTPDMKKLGDPTTEAVSMLLQDVLPRVLDCTLVANTRIRRRATICLKMMAESGLILMQKIIPHLIALSTDVLSNNSNQAKILLTTASEKWNTTAELPKAIEYAFLLASRLNPSSVVRGFLTTPTVVSTCHLVYELIPKSRPDRMKNFVDAIVSKISGSLSSRLLIFMIDQIVYLPYKTVGLVEHAVKSISSLLSNCPDDGAHVRLLSIAAAHMEKIYKSALKTAEKSQGGKEKVKRNDVPQDYIAPEMLNEIDDPNLFLKRLKADDDSDDEKGAKKPEKRRSAADQSKAAEPKKLKGRRSSETKEKKTIVKSSKRQQDVSAAKKPKVRKSDPGPSRKRKLLDNLYQERRWSLRNIKKKPDYGKDGGSSSDDGQTSSNDESAGSCENISKKRGKMSREPEVAEENVQSCHKEKVRPTAVFGVDELDSGDNDPDLIFKVTKAVAEENMAQEENIFLASDEPLVNFLPWCQEEKVPLGAVGLADKPDSDDNNPDPNVTKELEDSSDSDEPLASGLEKVQVKVPETKCIIAEAGPTKGRKMCYDDPSSPDSSPNDYYSFQSSQKVVKVVSTRVDRKKVVKKPLEVEIEKKQMKKLIEETLDMPDGVETDEDRIQLRDLARFQDEFEASLKRADSQINNTIGFDGLKKYMEVFEDNLELARRLATDNDKAPQDEKSSVEVPEIPDSNAVVAEFDGLCQMQSVESGEMSVGSRSVSSPCITRSPLQSTPLPVFQPQLFAEPCSSASLFSTPEEKLGLGPPFLEPTHDEMMPVSPESVISPTRLTSPSRPFSRAFKQERISSPLSGRSAMGSPDLPIKLEKHASPGPHAFLTTSAMCGSSLHIKGSLPPSDMRLDDFGSRTCNTPPPVTSMLPSSSIIGSYKIPLTVLGNRLAEAEPLARTFKSEPLSQGRSSEERGNIFDGFITPTLSNFKEEPSSSSS